MSMKQVSADLRLVLNLIGEQIEDLSRKELNAIDRLWHWSRIQ